MMADSSRRHETPNPDEPTDNVGPPWWQPEWFAEARAWIQSTLDRLAVRVTGDIEEVRMRP